MHSISDHLQCSQFGQFTVLRGDLVMGGIKTLALQLFLSSPEMQGKHIAYAGSVYGSGAWATARACAILGQSCSIFLSKSTIIPFWINDLLHLGTNIHWLPPSPVECIHEHITTAYPELLNLPLGFDSSEFIIAMSQIMRTGIPTNIDEIWLPAISGVLTRAACIAFPAAEVHTVSVVRHPGDTGCAITHKAPEKFYHPANTPPPYPSCPYSDAKVWQFASKIAKPGALICNTSQ